MEKTINVVILVRVSTTKQDTERQVSELKQYADSQGYKVIEICVETISGAKGHDQRAGLKRALELATAGKIDKVLVHEVSRIARKNSVAHNFIEALEDLGVSLYWHTQSIETLLPNGKRNPAAAIMFALLAEMARNERETLTERIRSGLNEARRKGITLGRPKGSQTTEEEFLEKHKDIVRQLRRGLSIRHTAAITKKGCSTVQRVKAIWKESRKETTVN